MRSRADELIRDHFRTTVTADDLSVWEGTCDDPFATVTLIGPGSDVSQVTAMYPAEPLTLLGGA